MKNDDRILEDSIFKIGRVISVDGRKVNVKVDKSKNTSNLLYKGELLKNISVGGYIKIIKGFTKIVGKVEGEFISEDKEFYHKEYKSEKEKINRILSISLLGFFKGSDFERGIKELPLIDNECFLLHKDEFNQVHNFLRGSDKPINIGALSLEKGQEIKVGINSLFASHIGIFGNTGSGKSYTLAKIYHELFKGYKDSKNFTKNAQFFLLDFNGEYVDEKDDVIIDKKYKNIYKLSTRKREGEDKFPISKETLIDPTFWAILAEATEKTQVPFLVRALTFNLAREGTSQNQEIRIEVISMIEEIIKKKDKNLGLKVFVELFSDLYVSTVNHARINDIKSFLRTNLGFNATTTSYYLLPTNDYNSTNFDTYLLNPLRERINTLEFDDSELGLIRLKIVIKYYDEIIKGYSNRDHLSPLMKRLENRIRELKKVITVSDAQDTGKNFTIVSLKDVNFDIRKVLPLLLCRKLYSEKRNKKDENAYLNIIIDEAHNILSWNSERESEQWKDYRLETFEEIIKEGKFGTCGELAVYTADKIKPILGEDYDIDFLMASQSGYFLAPRASHIVLRITKRSDRRQVYILDPSFHRYGQISKFDDYLFFQGMPVFDSTGNIGKDVSQRFNMAIPLLIRKDYLIGFVVESMDSQPGRNNFVLGLTLNKKYSYSGRYLFALRYFDADTEVFENKQLALEILSEAEWNTLKQKITELFENEIRLARNK